MQNLCQFHQWYFFHTTSQLRNFQPTSCTKQWNKKRGTEPPKCHPRSQTFSSHQMLSRQRLREDQLRGLAQCCWIQNIGPEWFSVMKLNKTRFLPHDFNSNNLQLPNILKCPIPILSKHALHCQLFAVTFYIKISFYSISKTDFHYGLFSQQ